MDQLSPGGVSVVVPAYLVCAGILFYAVITAAVMGVRRGSVPLYLSFAMACLSAAGASMAMASYLMADSMAGGLRSLRWLGIAETVWVASLFFFIARYTRARGYRPWFGAALAAAAIGVGAHLLAPQGMRFAKLHASGYTVYPWGETLFYLQGRPSAWTIAFYLVLAAIAVWSMVRAWRMREAGLRREATFLAAGMAFILAAVFHGALIDFNAVRSFQTLGFAMVLVAVLMGANLALRMHHQHRELEKVAAALRRENQALKEAEVQLRLRAFSDPLTGLPNRMFVQDHLTGLIERGAAQRHGAVMQCVLSHHQSGARHLSEVFSDELMREVTVRLADTVRGRGLIARTGPENFTVILDALVETEDGAAALAREMARDIGAALSRAIRVGVHSRVVFARIGYATFETRADTASQALADAQDAVNRGTLIGRGATIGEARARPA